MHERLFQGQIDREWGAGPSADWPVMAGYARALRLDTDAFQQCVQTEQFRPQIEADYREGIRQGVRSTPSFLVNGRLIVGALPFDSWQLMLDDLLAQPKQ
ncbi:MAG: hypothetical protein OHK0022_11210 [Roseiflexaceae bacterium]